jgi:hypothetical protein
MDETSSSAPRRASRPHRLAERGQVLVLLLIFLLPMTMAVMSVYNVGQVVSDKMSLQNAADNAAYSAAIWDARYMNQMAYINRAMVANYDTTATLVGLWSMVDAIDGLIGLVELVAKILFDIGDDVVKLIHTPIGTANQQIGTNIVGGSTASKRAAYYIEQYTLTLSKLQQVLYYLYQFNRRGVIESIAWGVDRGAQYWVPVEAYNVYSLSTSRKWEGTDKTTGLRRTVERSLNDFSNGGSLRDGIAGAAPQFIRDIKSLINSIPCPIPGGVFDISVGIQGFDGYPFNRVTGGVAGVFGTEFLIEAGPYAGHDIIEDTKISQVDFAGVKVSFCIGSLGIGHHSHDGWNLAGGKGGFGIGLFTPHIADANDGAINHHYNNFNTNGLSCIPIGGGLAEAIGEGFGKLNQATKKCNEIIEENKGKKDKDKKPEVVVVDGVVRSCRQVADIMNDVNQAQEAAQACQTSYFFDTPLRKVKVTTFESDDKIEDTGIQEGPNTLVYFRMKPQHLGLFDGLGVGPTERDYNLQAYAFAKAYNTTRVPPDWLSMKLWASRENWRTTLVKNPSLKVSQDETLFNPFWSGKLELPTMGKIKLRKGERTTTSFDPFLH